LIRHFGSRRLASRKVGSRVLLPERICTDVATITDGSIGTLDIPDKLNTIATYPIAATKSAKNADLAKKFVDYVLSADGQQIRVNYGFIIQ
jgi:hypothetical protein